MARYIDAVKTAEIISEKCGIDISELVDIFGEIPTADVEPARHGKWIWKDNEPDNYVCICSNCNSESEHLYNYCSNCGAKMDLFRK